MKSRAERRAARETRQRRQEASNRYQELAAEAKASGGSIGGTYRGEEPVYFIVPKDAPNEEIARLAFQAKHGRPMSPRDETLAGLKQDLWDPRPTRGPVTI